MVIMKEIIPQELATEIPIPQATEIITGKAVVTTFHLHIIISKHLATLTSSTRNHIQTPRTVPRYKEESNILNDKKTNETYMT